MPAQLILMNPSRPKATHSAGARGRLGAAVRAALDRAAGKHARATQRSNPLSARQVAEDAKKARFIAQHGLAAFRAAFGAKAAEANARGKAKRAAQRALGGSNAQIAEALRAERAASKQRTEKRNAVAKGMSLAEYRAWERAQRRKNPTPLQSQARAVSALHNAGVPQAVISRLISRFPGSSSSSASSTHRKTAAGLPRTNPQEKHMAKSKKRKNPSRKRKSVRRNPTPKGNLTGYERFVKSIGPIVGYAEAARIADLKFKVRVAKAKGPKRVWAPGERSALQKARMAALTPEQRAARKAKSAATREVDQSLIKAFRSGAEMSAEQMARASRLSGTVGTRMRGKYGAGGAVRGGKKWKGNVGSKNAYLFGPRHDAAFGFIKQFGKGPGAKTARAYLSAKRLIRGGDPAALQVAKALGLTALPNGGWMNSVKLSLPIMAAAAGGVVAVAWGASMLIPKIQDKIANPTVKKLLAPGIAVAAGLVGAWLLQKNKSTAKWSGALLAGGGAVAALAYLVSSTDAAGVSLAHKVGKGVLTLGDYHMGMTVGDYHMGDVAQLNVGDYHMGAIQVDNRRRELAPAGQPMPRHDTRRDNVDSYIDQFNGTLAGDMFDS